MPLKIKSVSGSVTLDAQNVSGDQTLTVPSLSGGKTLLTTDGDGSSLTGVGVDGITSASSSGTAISIASNNNVGVGIGTPTLIAGTGMHLHSSGSDCRFHISNNTVGGTSGDGAYLFMGSDGTFGIQQKEAAGMKFYNSGGVVLEITSDGRGLSQFTAKVWCNFEGFGSASSWEKDSHNVSSYNDDGTGNYRIHFANSLASRDFACAVTDDDYGSLARSYSDSSGSYVRLYAYDYGGSSTDTIVNCIIFGD
jgi:hypothetical protein